MFCPNCAAQNDTAQHFCRACGLKLDAIAEDLAAQRPSEEFAKLLARKRRFEMLGIFSISTAGIIGISMLIAGAFYYKMQWIGPELLFRSASIALVLFALASVFFFNYPKLVMKFDKLNPRLPNVPKKDVEPVTTRKLIEDRPFEPVPSVTEHSTELLKNRR